jgi:predicted nucleotidyltransferase
MDTGDKVLRDEIVRRVLSVSDPECIILFGSAARGDMTADSDLDLLVVEAAPADSRRRSIAIRKALRGIPKPFDVIVMSSERFKQTRDTIGGIAYPATQHGTVIYEVH